MKPKIIITLGSGVKDELDNIIIHKEPIEMIGLSPNIISKTRPFLGEFRTAIKAKIINMYHPSRIEGDEKENLYIRSLELIKNHV